MATCHSIDGRACFIRLTKLCLNSWLATMEPNWFFSTHLKRPRHIGPRPKLHETPGCNALCKIIISKETHMPVSRRALLKLRLAASLDGSASSLRASASYPSRPVRVVVSASPGTSMDTAARFLAAAIGATEGTTFVVENKVGANGIIATEHVARADPDGYTLLFTASTHYTNRWMQESLPYDVIEDFAPVARVANGPLVLVVPANSQARSLEELI